MTSDLRGQLADLSITMRATHKGTHIETEDGRDWKHDLWSCRFTMRGAFPGQARRTLTVPFKMGTGHAGEAPRAAEVMDCLLSDATGYDDAGSFVDWASEYGYDYDSRKAERLYLAVESQTEELKAFLGTMFDQLAYDTERL